MKIRIHDQGRWIEGFLPIDEVEDLDRGRRAAGYALVSSVDIGERSLIPRVQVWELQEESRSKAGDRAPGYLVDVHLQQTMDMAGAMTFVDLMDVLARWAPALEISARGEY